MEKELQDRLRGLQLLLLTQDIYAKNAVCDELLDLLKEQDDAHVKNEIRRIIALPLVDLGRSGDLMACVFFKTDPKSIAVAFCVLDNKMSQQMMMSLGVLVNNMAHGKKLIFVDSDFMSHKENEGHGDSYLNINQVAALLHPDDPPPSQFLALRGMEGYALMRGRLGLSIGIMLRRRRR